MRSTSLPFPSKYTASDPEPRPNSTVSWPKPRYSESSPIPPSKRLVPAPSCKMSLPKPPCNLSLPAPPTKVSCPTPPIRLSSPVVPLIVPPTAVARTRNSPALHTVPSANWTCLNPHSDGPWKLANDSSSVVPEMFSTKSSPRRSTARSFGMRPALTCTVSTAPVWVVSATISWPEPKPNRNVSAPSSPLRMSWPAPPSRMFAAALPRMMLFWALPIALMAPVPVSLRVSTLADKV